MLRTCRFWSECTFICESFSSSAKNLQEHLLILWSEYEILFLSAESASDSMSVYHIHDLSNQKIYTEFRAHCLTVIREALKEYKVSERLYAHSDEASLSKHSKKLQIEQTFSMIKWMRNYHDQMYQIQSIRNCEWLLTQRSDRSCQINVRHFLCIINEECRWWCKIRFWEILKSD